MKKFLAILLTIATVTTLTACGGSQKPTGDTSSGSGGNTATADNKPADNSPAEGATELELWTFNELHQQFYEVLEDEWNEANPDEQVTLKITTLPYSDMHNKLLIALQSGTGAPDIADIEIGKFANYLKGEPQLLPLNDVIEPELDNIVKARVEIYSKDENYYGIDFHVGASVMYYNKEILEEAGVDYTQIVTVADYLEAAEKVKAIGKFMTTVETKDMWHSWGYIASQGGDLLGEDGMPNINSEPVIKALTMQQDMLKNGTATVAPGGGHHEESYYGMMNAGEYASMSMPLWHMGRFTDYMPDLKGKMVIAPMPVFNEGDPRSVGLGGTGTTVTNQSKHPDLAKRYVAFAKLSKQGNIEIWNLLGFDPIRPEVWSIPEVHESVNKFTEYFANNPFDVLLSIEDEILPIHVSEYLPPTMDAMKTQVLPRVYDGLEDITTVVGEEQSRITVQ